MYVPISRKKISSYDVIFDENLSSALAYISQPYSESMDMRPDVIYTPCATSSRGETGDIIMFAHFEEVNILTKTRNDVESGDDDSIMPPLLSEEDIDAMGSGNN